MPSAGTWDGSTTHRRSSSRGSRTMVPISSPRLLRKYPVDAVVDDWGKSLEEQDELVHRLREILQLKNSFYPEKHDFAMLLRFLRARDYDVDRAATMFLDMLQWRQEARVDHILDEFTFTEREEFLSIFPQGYHKTDKQGHPVYIQHLGRVDLTRIREVTTEERMLKYHVQEWERCMKHIFPICSKLHNRQIDSTFAVIDVKGVGFYHLTKEVRRVLATIMKIDSDNYPETLFHTCIINAPTAFRAIWAVIKPMLNKRTQGKIEVCPKDFMSVLRHWIDEDAIPEYLGGMSKGTLIDDIGPWRTEPLLKEIDTERSGQAEVAGDLLTRSSRAEDWMATRQASTLSNATVYEDAETYPAWGESGLLEEGYLDDGALGVYSGLDPPLISDAASGSGTPVRGTSLAARIQDLETKFPRQMERLRTFLTRDDKDRLSNFSSASRGSLMGRVEVLEEGMELLLGAQERSWEDPTAPKSSTSCVTCRCCSIM